MSRDNQNNERDSSSEKRDTASVTPRARALLRRGVTVVTRDKQRDKRRDSDRPAEAGPSPSRLPGGKFDGWIAGASAEQQARFERANAAPVKPLTNEQQELFRLCGDRILARHRAGHKFAPEALADARRWAAFPALQTPMGPGDPVTDDQLPPALRGGALEVF